MNELIIYTGTQTGRGQKPSCPTTNGQIRASYLQFNCNLNLVAFGTVFNNKSYIKYYKSVYFIKIVYKKDGPLDVNSCN